MYYWRVKRQKRGVSRPTPHYSLIVEVYTLCLTTTGCSVSVCSTRSAVRLEVVATMVLAWLAVTLAMTLAVTLAVVEVTVMLAWVVVVVVTKVAAVVMWLVVWLVVHGWRTAMEVVVCAYALGRHGNIYNNPLWSAVA